MNTYFEKAIAILGGQTALARAVGVKQAHVWKWLNRKDGEAPPAMVIPICEATEWQITPHQLRPDIYPHPDDGLPKEKRTFGTAA